MKKFKENWKKIIMPTLAIVVIFLIGIFLKNKQFNQSQTQIIRETITFIRNNNLWVSTNGTEKQLTTDAPSQLYKVPGQKNLLYLNPKISPDGENIAYIQFDITNNKKNILFTSIKENTSKLMTETTGNVIGWLNNDELIFYSSSNTNCDENFNCDGSIEKINIITKQIDDLTQFKGQGGCGGGGLSPSESLAMSDRIIGGEWMGFGNLLITSNNIILFNLNCDGSGFGTISLDSKKVQILDKDAIMATISPNGLLAAAIKDNKITIYSIDTGKILNQYETTEQPLTFLWTSDGQTLLYTAHNVVSSYQNGKQVPIPTSRNQENYVLIYQTGLYNLNPSTGNINKLESFDIYGARIISYNSIQNTIILSEVDNDSITNNSPKPTINVFRLRLSNQSSEKIVSNSLQTSYFSQ